jgi:hypothetical protein
MANTTTGSDLVVTKFLSDFFAEYFRENLFFPYMGSDSNKVIQVKEGRQLINIPLVSKLSGNGVTGSATLDGNEEILANYAYTLTPTYHRNAVRLSAEEREKPAIDLMRAAKEMLKGWGMEKVRDDIIVEALGSFNNSGTIVTVEDSTAAINTAADAWVANNTDRVLYGATTANYSAGDHSASLANVDTTNDKLTGDVVRLARKIARTCDPIIKPIRVAGGIETYVMFVGTQAFLHLQEDLETLHSNAGNRGEGNPLFKPGDLMWDNVVVREVPEISSLLANSSYYATAGNSSSKVEPAFLCGAQAVGYGLGQKPNLVADNDKDYRFQPGVAVELKHDIDKLVYNNKDHGLVSVFVTGE